MKRISRVNSTPLLSCTTGDDPEKGHMIFENLEWFTTAEAALYLRKLNSDGTPSMDAIHQMVCRGVLRRRKFAGRLYFKRRELDFLIESSAA